MPGSTFSLGMSYATPSSSFKIQRSQKKDKDEDEGKKVVEDGVAYDVPSGHLTVHTASAFCQRAPPVKTMHSGEMQSNFLEKGKGKSKQSEQSNKLALPWMK